MFAALCSWSYNLGTGALQRSRLRRLYLNDSRYEEAADDFLHDTGMDATIAAENEVFKLYDISKIAVNSPTVSPNEIRQVYSIADPAERREAKIALFPTKEEFKSRMKQCILLILNTADYAAKFKSQTWNDNKSIDDILSIQDRMATQGGF